MRNTLISELPKLGLVLSDAQLDSLCAYGQAMLEKNQVMNLTAITQPDQVALLHFCDSLTLLSCASFAGASVIDVGCGAGLPGVPLKIAAPTCDLTLLDSLGKRMDWLREILPTLGVEAQVLTARAEEAVQDRRERYDIAVSRAVARLNILAELCLPYVKVGGRFLAMKGQRLEEELPEAEQAIRTLGGKVLEVRRFPIGEAEHLVAVIEKVVPTPEKYPRRYNKIKAEPL